MSSLLDWLVDPAGLTPHGFCLSWEPGLVWLHAGSDLLIGIAYFSIPVVLARFALRRRDFGMGAVPWLFTGFILACGTTHFLAVLTLWVPAYGLEGLVKALTAIVSVVTAVILWPLLPRALAIPAPATLQRLNLALQAEVAARAAAAAELRDSEARYRVLYNEAPAAMHTLDSDGRVVGVNDEWTRLLGYSHEQALHRPIDELLTPDSAEARRADWPVTSATALTRNLERCFRRADGGTLDALVSIRRQSDPADGTVRFLVVVTDISDRKRAEAALQQAQKMEAIGRLTGGIAHDFNNMLTAIRGSLELLRGRTQEDERAARLVETGLLASDRAARLTGQLLSFARKQRLEPRVLSPAGVLAGMAELLANTAGPRVTLRFDAARGLDATCLADQGQLESALLNLVVNGVRAIAEEGSVTIRVEARALASDLVDPRGIDETLEAGRYVRIAVEDDGVGMTEAVRRQAFDPFFTTRPPGEGTGLGLSQIQGFVHQSGGHVRIASRPGHGTTVEIWLPACEGVSPQPERSFGTQMPQARPGEVVLVVEDEPTVREVACETLRGLGYKVAEAADAAAALALLGRGIPVTALFTDLAMPGHLDGIALARAATTLRPGLGVLLASGFSGGTRSDWPPAWGFVAKPYAPPLLARSLRQAIDATARRPVLDPGAA